MDPEVKHVETAVQPPDAAAQPASPTARLKTAQESYEASLTAYNTERDGNMNVSLNGVTPPDEIESAESQDGPKQ